MTETTSATRPAGRADDLYAGEPVALHATEMPLSSAAEARARARAALASRDVDLALYLYVQALSFEPEDTDSLYAIGAIHAERGNTELAARAYGRVCELNPAHSLAQQGLGLALFDARQFDLARTALQSAVEIDASLWRAHDALGIIADRDGRYDLAVEHYTAAIATQPARASIRNNRGYSRYLAGDLEGARMDFLAALEIDSGYLRAWQNLGLVLARLHDYRGALSAMQHATPEHVALNDVGYIAMMDGDFQSAQSLFEDAIIASPRHYQTAHENLAELRRRRSGHLLATGQ